jgi:hypothetical protein
MIPNYSTLPRIRPIIVNTIAFAFLAAAQLTALAAQAPVDLRTAGNFAILAKSGISTVPSSAITGDMGASPIDSTAITGFSLILDPTTQFATSTQVSGKVYAANYTTPTPTKLTAAVSDMETAFTDAAGRSLPDHTELGSGNIGGLTLAPGLYKWGTDVTIPADVTISGGPNDVWIFQVSGNIIQASSASVVLSGGAQAGNVFWQVEGGVGVDIGSSAHFEGIILAKAGINLKTGASVHGRLLSQTAVTLQANAVTQPIPRPKAPHFGPISRNAAGVVTFALTNSPNVEITIQHSTDLVVWTPFSKPTPSASPYIGVDSTTANQERRFYRAFYP